MRNGTRRFAIASWVFVALWAAFIFFMSSNTSTGLNEGLGVFSRIYQVMKDVQASLLGPGVDVLSSIAHFCEYTVFGALLANALRCHMPLGRACVLAIVCGSLYGVTDEFHQLFVPGRAGKLTDVLIDCIGVSLITAVLWLRFKRMEGSYGVNGTNL